MRKKIIILLFFCVLLLGCRHGYYEQQGYVEGDYTYISPNYQGVLEALLVRRGTFVKAGTPLYVLEQQPESSTLKQTAGQLSQAQEQKAQIEANLELAKIQLTRQENLFKVQGTPKESLDEARANFKQVSAQLAAAIANINAFTAALEQAAWTKGKKVLCAPKSGLVFDTFFTQGELVPANQPVVVMLIPENVYTVFYLPEPYLGQLHLGKVIQVFCDNCPKPIAAKIGYISPQAEYTPPIIFSQDMRAKLVYRIHAYPALEDAFKIHPGQPVTVRINYEKRKR